MIKSIVATAVTGLLLAGCGDDKTSASPASASSVTTAPAGPMAEDPTLIAQVKRAASADSDVCFLPEGVAIETRQIDLGGGAVGVVVLCSTGTADRWQRLYVRSGTGGQARLQSMLVYDLEGDEQWHAHTEIPELTWDGATGTFTGATALQATGCGWKGRWRWDGRRMALVEMKRVGCQADGDPDMTWWPTTPPTPEPTPVPEAVGTE